MTPRLLFVSPRFLFPVDSGGKIRTTQILRGLKGGTFEVTLAAPASPGDRQRYAVEIGQVCDRFASWDEPRRSLLFPWARLRHLFSADPIPVATDRSVRGARVVHSLLSLRPDVAVFDFPHSAVMAPKPIDVPSVLFTHNVEAEIFARHAQVAAGFARRWLWSDQHRKMVRFERDVLNRFDTVVAVSERDAAQFGSTYGVTSARVINTGVDLDYFLWSEPPASAEIIFSGSMDWMANQDGIVYFMDEIWPRIARSCPDARMTVLGRAPPTALVSEARDRGLNWRFTGYVDDIREFVGRATAYVIPLRVGGGTRLKVFEAMAMGRPVVSTSVGVEGLPLEPDVHYLRADNPDSFADAVLRLLNDAELRARLARAARRHVEANFSFQSVAREFERICLDTAAAKMRGLSPAKHCDGRDHGQTAKNATA